MVRYPVLFSVVLFLLCSCDKTNAVVQGRPASPTTAAPNPACGTHCDDTTPCEGASCGADNPPTLDFTAPKDGERITGKTLLVQGVATDDRAGLQVEVSLDGTHWKPGALTSGRFEVSFDLPDTEDEVVMVRARAVDAAGKQVVAVEAVHLDNVAPRVTVDPMGNVTPAEWLAGRVILGDAADGSGPVTVRLDLDDGRGFVSTPVTAGRWEALYRADPKENGKVHALTVEATDVYGNSSLAHASFRVDVVGPRLVIGAPANGARLNAADLAPLNGVVKVQFQVIDGDATTVVRLAGTTTPVTEVLVLTDPTDDGRGYSVELEALDGAGNRDTARVDFSVDRVSPHVMQLVPADGSVTALAEASIEFSEPMQTALPGFSSTPSTYSRVWSADRKTFEATFPSGDTAYTLTASALTDDYGNPLVVAPVWHVVTSPKQPADGTVIATSVSSFTAVSDPDGVVSVVAVKGGFPTLYRTDTQGGGFVQTQSFNGSVNPPALPFAWKSTDPTRPFARLSGARVFSSAGVPQLLWWVGGQSQSTPAGAAALIPVPAFAWEGSGLGAVGFIRAGNYERAGANPQAVAVRPDHVAGVDGRWEIVELSPSGFMRQSFSCEPAAPGAAPTCSVSPAAGQTGFSLNPRYSHAVTRRCSFHVFNNTAGNRVMWAEPFPGTCRIGNCPQPFNSFDNLSDDLQIATGTDTTMLGARRYAQGLYVFESTPDSACNPRIGFSATLPAMNAVAFQPVRVGGRAGLVWLDDVGALRLFAP